MNRRLAGHARRAHRSARAGPPVRRRRRPGPRRTIRAARPAGHEVLPLPPQPRVRWQPLPGNRSRHDLAAAGPTPGGQNTPRPAPRSNANDRTPDAPQARRPALPRVRTGQGRRQLALLAAVVTLARLASLDSRSKPAAGRQTPPEHPGNATPHPGRFAAQHSTAAATSQPRARRSHTQLHPHGQRRPHARGLPAPRTPIQMSLQGRFREGVSATLPACKRTPHTPPRGRGSRGARPPHRADVPRRCERGRPRPALPTGRRSPRRSAIPRIYSTGCPPRL